MDKTDIKSLNLAELKKEMELIGEKPFRAAQIYEWLHKKLCDSFDEMTNLSVSLREKLSERYEIAKAEPVDIRTSKIDDTKKFLFRLNDGNVIESVWMKYHHGNSVCISSQVGCRMGCTFCASTIDGMVRNLRPSEMLEQIYRIQKITQERVSNIVVMGSGEPFDNFENLLKFIELITSDCGLDISQRNITVSTCGLVDRIYELAEKKLQITLALSLHASDDETRRTLMPVANKYSIDEILKACDYYYKTTGRRVTYEYSLVGGVNDSEQHAVSLAKLLKGRHCHVNLIPVNPVKERKYVRSNRERVVKFKNILEKYAINVSIRRELGMDIDGACGQLRRSYRESGDNN